MISNLNIYIYIYICGPNSSLIIDCYFMGAVPKVLGFRILVFRLSGLGNEGEVYSFLQTVRPNLLEYPLP